MNGFIIQVSNSMQSRNTVVQGHELMPGVYKARSKTFEALSSKAAAL